MIELEYICKNPLCKYKWEVSQVPDFCPICRTTNIKRDYHEIIKAQDTDVSKDKKKERVSKVTPSKIARKMLMVPGRNKLNYI